MPSLLQVIAVVFCCVTAANAASFIVEKSQVRVKGENGFNDAFPAAVGDFGIPSYGAILMGKVAYLAVDPVFCSSSFAPLPPDTDILLVDRGSCYFVEKAYHAQTAGAKAVLVADNLVEDLITMAAPEDSSSPEVAALVAQVAIPTVLITKDAGDKIKAVLALQGGGHVTAELDWSESIHHGTTRVAWELWFTTNDGCGRVCSSLRAFFKTFRAAAAAMEAGGHVAFTPHVMTQACAEGSISYGCEDCFRRRYCAVEPVPEGSTYSGVDVVEMNARFLCAYQAANSTGNSAAWWDFAAGFSDACSMAGGSFDAGCARQQLEAGGIDAGAVEKCVGPRDVDAPHELLEAQQRAQADEGESGRGRVVMLPTVVVNFDQYRGSLTAAGVMRALCSGFAEGSEPAACLSGGIEVNECAGGHDCWLGELAGGAVVSACVDTFRGYVCRCPAGWEGDGHTCTDVEECALGVSGCDQICVNTPGSYRCDCKPGYTLHGGHGGPGMCLPHDGVVGTGISSARLVVWLLLFGGISVAGVLAYHWRARQQMHGEIRAILCQYMPLAAGPEAAETGRADGGGGSKRGDGGASQGVYAAPTVGGGGGETQLTPLA